MRFYELTKTIGGPLPPTGYLQVGTVIRVPRSNSRKPGPQWNAETCDWIVPVWTEVSDPKAVKP